MFKHLYFIFEISNLNFYKKQVEFVIIHKSTNDGGLHEFMCSAFKKTQITQSKSTQYNLEVDYHISYEKLSGSSYYCAWPR